ncbi:hypothetical protein ACHHYP_07123 [Achlya hypogyna]|uniref:Kinesin motor domain-containing protein n=1 Tax=Achlya hypogyna TaxID=1202772 RepID=A0A1V9ZMQ0_ACHHY|nr:hypothetical protein ACHHYP_07123 [Achlya hypogyna]
MAVAIFLAGPEGDKEDVGISKASDCCVRLEPSPLSPGVASINFDAVADARATSDLYRAVVQPAVHSAMEGRPVTIVAAGASGSGKSNMMHGIATGCTGIVQLALADVFDEIARRIQDDSTVAYLVEMSCSLLSETHDEPSLCETFVPVRSLDDALKHHKSFVATNFDGSQHAVITLRLESLAMTENNAQEAIATSAVFVDIAGPSMIALPRSAKGHTEYFSCSPALSASLSSRLLPPYSPVLMMGLRTQRIHQQQAIQSLLYACRVKDLPTTMPIVASSTHSTLAKLAGLVGTDIWLPTERDLLKKYLPKVLCHASGVWHLKTHALLPQLYIKQAPPSPILSRASTNAGDTSGDEDIVKEPILESSRSVLEAIDALFGSVGQDHGRAVVAATPVSKLRMIHSWWKETQDDLHDEEALTLKCSSRLGRLQACIQTQRAQYDAVVAEKRALQEALSASQDQLRTVSAIVGQLQADVAALKRKGRPLDDPVAAQFSARLAKVIDDTKQVVAMKDAHIAQLETSVNEGLTALRERDAAVADLQRQLNEVRASQRADDEPTLAALQSKHSTLHAHKEVLEAKYKELQSTCAATEAEKAQLEAALQEAKDELAGCKDVDGKLRSCQSKNAELRAKVERLKATNMGLVKTKQTLERRVDELVVALRAAETTRETERRTQQECIDTIEKLTNMCQHLEQQTRQLQNDLTLARAEQTRGQSHVAALEAMALDRQFKAAAFHAALTRTQAQAERCTSALADDVTHLRQRVEHLMRALATSNEHESRAKAHARELEVQVDEIHRLRREHFHLHAVLEAQDHKVRVLERRLAK